MERLVVLKAFYLEPLQGSLADLIVYSLDFFHPFADHVVVLCTDELPASWTLRMPEYNAWPIVAHSYLLEYTTLVVHMAAVELHTRLH